MKVTSCWHYQVKGSQRVSPAWLGFAARGPPAQPVNLVHFSQPCTKMIVSICQQGRDASAATR